MRQSYAGMLWSKQFYHYGRAGVARSDPAGPVPPLTEKKAATKDWTHLYNDDIISMPDKWEYPVCRVGSCFSLYNPRSRRSRFRERATNSLSANVHASERPAPASNGPSVT